jgi:hypothetical protein
MFLDGFFGCFGFFNERSKRVVHLQSHTKQNKTKMALALDECSAAGKLLCQRNLAAQENDHLLFFWSGL